MAETSEVQKAAPPEQPRTYTLKAWEWAQAIANELGIRLSHLEKLQGNWLGTLQANDTFSMIKMLNGSYMLTKLRIGLQASFILPKEAIYKDIEAGPTGFPSIAFQRIPATHEYLLTGKNGESLGETSIIIPTAQLDQFKSAVNNISWKLITECGTRKAAHDLACRIKDNDPFKHTAVTINSDNFFDFIPTHLSMGEFANTTNKIPNVSIIKALVQSLYPEDTKKLTAKK